MSSWTKRLQEILDNEVANKNKRVFLLEGQDDVSCYRSALTSHSPAANWDQTWAFTYAGSKDFVLKIIAEQPDWIGLIDRDEWTPAQIQERQAAYPNLRVLPRYCMESYLIVPEELWSVLPAHYKERIRGGETLFRNMIMRDFAKWVRHGVLWSIINPLQTQLIDSGFKDYLLTFDNIHDDLLVQQKLQDWSTILDAHALYAEFQQRLTRVQALPEFEQLTQWVHGKKFWESRVLPVLTRFLGRRDTYNLELWELLKLPAELIPTFQDLAALEAKKESDSQ